MADDATTDAAPEPVDEREHLSEEQAIAMLPDGDEVHTFRGTGPVIIGCGWPRDELIDAIRKHGAELAGPGATAMGHGMVLFDEDGPLFIETNTAERGE